MSAESFVAAMPTLVDEINDKLRSKRVLVALYRGRHSGRLGPRLLAWWQRCDWSHAMIVWEIDGDKALVSEATLRHGVHTGWRYWSPLLHDCWEIEADARTVRAWWDEHEGDDYDTLGLAGFILRRIKGRSNAAWCSEAVVESLGIPDGWRWDVALLACLLRWLGTPVKYYVQHD